MKEDREHVAGAVCRRTVLPSPPFLTEQGAQILASWHTFADVHVMHSSSDYVLMAQ